MEFVSKRTPILALIMLVLLAGYSLLGFYLLPTYLHNKCIDLMGSETGLSTKIQQISFNPFSFELTVDGFSITDVNNAELLGFDQFYLNIDVLTSIKRFALVVDEIELHHPHAHIERDAKGSINFIRLKSKTAAQSAEAAQNKQSAQSPLPPLWLLRAAITNAEINWLDLSNNLRRNEMVSPINLQIDNLSTISADKAEIKADLQIGSSGRLTWRGELSLISLAGAGHVQLDDLSLAKLWQLGLREILPLQIAQGHLNTQVDYQFAQNNEQFDFSLNQGEIFLKDLRVIAPDKDDETWITLPSLQLTGIQLDSAKRHISMHAASAKDANIKIWRQADGLINYQTLLPVAATDTAVKPPVLANDKPDKSVWRFDLVDVALQNFLIEFSDLVHATPASFRLSNLNLAMHNISSQSLVSLPLQLSTQFNDEGTIGVTGSIGLHPVNTALALDIKNIKLKNFQSYLDDFLNIEIVDGGVNTQGNLQLAVNDNVQIQFQGDADVAGLLTRDKVDNKDFLKWTDLQFQHLDVDLAKQTISLENLLFDRPYLRLSVAKDHTTNLADIVLKKNQASTAAKTEKASVESTNQPVIDIRRIQFKAGSSDFSDFSLILPFVAKMNGLNGEIDGFASNQNQPVKLKLQGKVYDMAEVNIKGSYQIKTADSDIELDYVNMPLPLITPYMAEFAGYKIEKGQMALNLHYNISNGQLNAQNKIYIDQLILGDQVENPRAVSIPLHLAVALLKDADGKIKLDFPVTGSLNDPQFSIGSLISDVLSNFLDKIVSAPFKALGEVLSDDHDYSSVKFSAGSSSLVAEETSALDQLSEALKNKPDLTIDIKGLAYQEADWPSLRFEALKDILKKMKSGELHDQGRKVRSEYIELDNDEYQRLLEKFFKEVFPQDIEYSLLGKARVKSQPDTEFYSLARQKLEEVMQPDQQRLTDLAIARAHAISQYLTEKCQLDARRVYILAPEVKLTTNDGIIAILSLNAAE